MSDGAPGVTEDRASAAEAGVSERVPWYRYEVFPNPTGDEVARKMVRCSFLSMPICALTALTTRSGETRIAMLVGVPFCLVGVLMGMAMRKR